MCGIVGLFGNLPDQAERVVGEMADRIRHRGPDDAGVWVDSQGAIAFGFRRLAIIDPSPAGRQPMASPSSRYHIVFNGEIYNFRQLIDELGLSGGGMRGHSDSEVLTHALDRWGVRETLDRIQGMFAIAAWDHAERRLWLARDRMGEKPLSYGRIGNSFVFASELHALRAHPDFRGKVDRSILALYLRTNCVPAPYSIYQGFAKLPPGHYLCVREGDTNWEPQPYWRLDGPFAGPSAAKSLDSQNLEDRLMATVAQQMESDVPLGALLSGGIDSSLVVALMQAQSTRPVKTFTIGFREPRFDEAPFAKKVAEHLGTDHHELYVEAKQALDLIPKLATIYDEPFSSASQIPTLMVSQLARKHVTVCLTGDGGDELFAGYTRYPQTLHRWQRLSRVPFRHQWSHLLSSVPKNFWDRLAQTLGMSRAEMFRLQSPGQRVHRLAQLMTYKEFAKFYQSTRSHWQDPERIVIGSHALATPFDRPVPDRSLLRSMMFWDQSYYLPDDNLVKTDRASMSVSLELRSPLIDHRVVEDSWRMDDRELAAGGIGKLPLRRILAKYVPSELFERPKMGFAVPIAEWLRGPLREWAESHLSQSTLCDQGFFEPIGVTDVWRRHLAGETDASPLLWDVLMFQSWLAENPES